MINEEIDYRCIDWPDLELDWAAIYRSPWTTATVFKSIIDKVPAVIYNPACLFHLFQSPNTSWLEALNMFYTSEGAGIMTVFSIYFIWKHSIISCIRKGQSNSEPAIDFPYNVVKHFMHIFRNNNHIMWVLSVKKNPYIATLLLSSIINIVRQVSLP